MPEANAAIGEDRLLDGALRLRQPLKGHRAGTDAVLLAAAAQPHASGTIVDLGCGVGTVGLILGLRAAGTRLLLVERDPGLARLAKDNAEANGLGARAMVIEADIAAPAAILAGLGLGDRIADLVVCNPPFLAEGEARASPDARRRAAHVMPDRRGDAGEPGLGAWVRCARRLLKPRGRLVLIHRADALSMLLASMGKGFGGLAIRAIHPRADEAAIRVIVSGTAQSRAPATILPGLVLHGPDGGFTSQAEAIHRGEELLD
jgi:tRNA1(Val) A37 N6-methylase TrmN6